MKQEEVKTPPARIPLPAVGLGSLLPVSPCQLPPDVTMAWYPSQAQGEGSGAGEEPERACPATYLPGHQTLAGDSWLLPAHASAAALAHTTPLQNNLAPRPGHPDSPGEGAVGTPRRKERHAPRREGAPEETGEPRRREPRSGAAAAREGEARTHVRGRRRPPASAGVPGTARAGSGGAAAGEKWGREGEFSPCTSALLPHRPPKHLPTPNHRLWPQEDGVG